MRNPPLILWTILFISQFFYAVVLETVLKSPESETQILPLSDSPIVLALGILSIATLTLAWLIPKMIWKTSVKNLPSTAPNESDLLEGFFTGFVLRLALLESVCLYGFIAGFLQQQPSLILPFLGASAAGFVANFPNRTFIRKTLGQETQSG